MAKLEGGLEVPLLDEDPGPCVGKRMGLGIPTPDKINEWKTWYIEWVATRAIQRRIRDIQHLGFLALDPLVLRKIERDEMEIAYEKMKDALRGHTSKSNSKKSVRWLKDVTWDVQFGSRGAIERHGPVSTRKTFDKDEPIQ